MSSSGTAIWLGSSSGTLVPATLVSGLAERHLTHWHEHWRPARDAALAKLRAAHAKPPEHAHWNWEVLLRNRSGLLAYAGYAVECDDMTQGLLLLDLTGTARLPSQVGKPLVLVEYLETAPWNNPDFQQPKRFGGVGTHLMRAAFERSIDEGFRGRIGLKSLPQAEEFYRDRCSITDLGPDPTEPQMRYFEATEAQALTFCNAGRTP